MKAEQTRREALTHATFQLAHIPCLQENARRDAELLLLHHLGINLAQLLADPGRILTPEEATLYQQSIARRLALEPIQYITGVQEFYGLAFRVTPAVLIPRPETELLVEATLQRLPHNQPLNVADIGTGSGILAITLATHLPLAEITAIDISPEALALARRNAETHHVTHCIHFVEGDLLAAIPNRQFDAIISNPPYVPTSDRETLHPQVRDHEPARALFAGPNGLDIYARLIPQAHAALTPGGLLALEIGQGQHPAVEKLLTGWSEIEILNDLNHIPRTILARKPKISAPEHNTSMKPDELQAHLCVLEERLLHPDREANRSALTDLIADDFREFGCSGRVISREQVIEILLNSHPRAATISFYSVESLSDTLALATYHITTLTSVTLRSSLWVFRNQRWQMLFHQGTIAT